MTQVTAAVRPASGVTITEMWGIDRKPVDSSYTEKVIAFLRTRLFFLLFLYIANFCAANTQSGRLTIDLHKKRGGS